MPVWCTRGTRRCFRQNSANDVVVDVSDAHTATLEPLAEEAKDVAVIAHGLARVTLRLRRGGVFVEVRTEEPGAVAAQDLCPVEVVIQHGFSFGGASAAGRSHPDYAASRRASVLQARRRSAHVVTCLGITRRSA